MINAQGIKDNAQHIAGILIGLAMRRSTYRFGKDVRGAGMFFSHVAANLTADRQPVALLPYRVFI